MSAAYGVLVLAEEDDWHGLLNQILDLHDFFNIYFSLALVLEV
jgi:hypothetical protein